MSSRRKFLKKLGLTTVAAGLLPVINLNAFPKLKPEEAVDCDPTTIDYYGQGPFYTADAPEFTDQLADENEAGDRMVISGSVYASDCITKVPNALLDIWHANDDGQYDNSGFNLRGKVYADENGDYSYETILPGKYLNGSSFRPRHIHLKSSAAGFNSLTTQIYFEGDDSIPTDAAASINSGIYDATDRIISLNLNEETDKLEGVFDVILLGSDTGILEESPHLHFGMIQEIAPNPIVDQSRVKFSVYKRGNVKLSLYNSEGKLQGVLLNERTKPGKFEINVLRNKEEYSSGTYFLVLQTNGLDVHQKKIILA